MKKRIISIALVVVMIVAMIPAVLLPTAAIDYYDGYETARVNADAINVDASATPDTAYLSSEKIISRSLHGSASGEVSTFYAYTAADDKGLYFWINVSDTSLNKGDGYEITETTIIDGFEDTVKVKKYVNPWAGDRVQLYMRTTSTKSEAIGSYGFDYLEQLEGSKKTGTFSTNGVKFAATVVPSTGWVAELYIPWTSLSTGYEGHTTDDMNLVAIGIQCNNYTNDVTITTKDGKEVATPNDSALRYSYDTRKGGSYYRGMYSNHSFTINKYVETDKEVVDGKKKVGDFKSAPDNVSGWEGTMCVPLSFSGFKTAVVTDSITVDGVMDAAYAKSEVIDAYDAAGKGKNFTGYTVATLQGLYVYADIIDSTLDKGAETTVDKGDKFQFYFQMGNHFANTNWGYIEMDYRTEGSNFRYVDKASGWYNNAIAAANIIRATTKTETGWTAELFIPWAGNIALNGLNDLNKLNVSVGLQVNNYTDAGGQITYCLSDYKGGGYWYANNGSSGGPSGHFYLTPLVFDFDADVPNTVTRWANYTDSITLDGVKDAKYSAYTLDKVDTVYKGGWHYGDINLANVYYAFTDTDMYAFVEVIDNTVSNSKTYEYACIYMATSDWAGKWNLSPYNGGTFNNNGNYEYISGKSFTLDNGTLAITYNGTKDNYTGYNVEFKMPLSEAEKAAIAAGKPVQIGVGVEINDAGTDGNRISYGFNVAGGGYWYQTGAELGMVSMPKVTLDKNLTEADFAVTPNVEEVSVSLGESIDLNLYADLPLNATDAQVKVTFNEKEYYLNAQKTNTRNEYKFTFENIAPQAIGDVIVADLIVDGQTISLKKAEDGFTVANYLNAIKGAEDGKYDDVIDALLLYGAAAQQYTNYKTDAFVADLATLVAPTMNKSVKEVDSALDNARFAAAGVHYANINKIFVKVEATDIADITFTATKNGAPIALELAEIAEGVYIAYTDGIKATEFGDVYTFTITDGTAASQTLTYSVYSYAEAMQANAKNPNTKTLVNALYNYGVAAEDLK